MHPISYLQALILGLTQGIAEPFPVSSLGHGVIIPSLFGWNIHQNDDYFLAFLVATHCATALVLFFYFLRSGFGLDHGLVGCDAVALDRHRLSPEASLISSGNVLEPLGAVVNVFCSSQLSQ